MTLADVAPTAERLLGAPLPDATASTSRRRSAAPLCRARELYAESFAPLVEFGWAPLRSIRSGPWKLIAAPKPELFDIEKDPGEQTNLAASQPTVARDLRRASSRYSPASLPTAASATRRRPNACARSATVRGSEPQSAIRNARPDPKDRRELAARIAQVTSGELTGAALVAALEGIVRDDPGNGQAHLRLGYARLQAGDCARAEPEFNAAAAPACRPRTCTSGSPRASAGATISPAPSGRSPRRAGSSPTTRRSSRTSASFRRRRATFRQRSSPRTAALAADPNLHEARFNLALAYAKAGPPRRGGRRGARVAGPSASERAAARGSRTAAPGGPVSRGAIRQDCVHDNSMNSHALHCATRRPILANCHETKGSRYCRESVNCGVPIADSGRDRALCHCPDTVVCTSWEALE